MLPKNKRNFSMIEHLRSQTKELNRTYPLPRTHIKSCNITVDGIESHIGMDRNIYWKFLNGNIGVTPGFIDYRFTEFILKTLTPTELANLCRQDVVTTETTKTTYALLTDYCFYDREKKQILGDMGYSLGGDYQDTQKTYTKTDNEEKIIKDYVEDITWVLKEIDEDETISIYTIEKHTYNTSYDKDGNEIETKETEDDKTTLFNIFNCTEQEAQELGITKDFKEGKNIFIKQNTESNP